MYQSFIILCLQTLIFWLIVVFLHRSKEKLTLIPLYAFLAILTLLTHNLSDLGFAITINNWFFLISSFSFFTALMFGVLYLYLFEGPKAVRLALWVILLSSFFYVAVVYFLSLITDTSNWINFDATRVWYYFCSVTAIIIDVIFLAIAWELLSRIKFLNLVSRVFIIIFFVLALDTLIFDTLAFGSSDIYFNMLKGNLTIRLILSLIGAPIMATFLKVEGFAEEKRNKPKNFWSILSFRTEFEKQIDTLEDIIAKQKIAEENIKKEQKLTNTLIDSIPGTFYMLDAQGNYVRWNAYQRDEIVGKPENQIAGVNALTTIHPDDREMIKTKIANVLSKGIDETVEGRVLLRGGPDFRWLLMTGRRMMLDNQPYLVGIGIDITARKQSDEIINKKLNEIEEINKLMTGRELQMIELKKQIAELKNK